MGRGQGKASDLGNNGVGYEPWTWTACDWWDRPVNQDPMQWSSNRHNLRVLAIDGGKFVISNERGNFLRGSKRVRRFRSLAAAQIAADVQSDL